MFHGALDATFAAFGIDALYTPAGGEPIPVRVIARRPDTIVGFGGIQIPHVGLIGRRQSRSGPSSSPGAWAGRCSECAADAHAAAVLVKGKRT